MQKEIKRWVIQQREKVGNGRGGEGIIYDYQLLAPFSREKGGGEF